MDQVTRLKSGVCWPEAPKVRQTHCHHLIARTAAGMAYEVYDTVMKNNEWYKVWKERNPELNAASLEAEFVRLVWPTLIDEARATLAAMLANPSLDPLQAEQIYDCLCLDQQLIRGGKRMSTASNPGGRLN